MMQNNHVVLSNQKRQLNQLPYLKERDDVRGHCPERGDLLVADGRAQLRHHVDHVGRVVLEVQHAVLRLLADQLNVQFPERSRSYRQLIYEYQIM